MAAFASIDVTSPSLGRLPTQVGVYRLVGDVPGDYQYLPNVRVLKITQNEGADPGHARFRYVFDEFNPPGVPNSFQQALSVNVNLPGVVQNDDRLTVFAFNPDGSRTALFDGFALVPELNLSPTEEMVAFTAVGVAVRCWDTPIGGALMRNADTPTKVVDLATDVPTYFNPAGLPNATPAGADASDTYGNTYPTFLDPLVMRDPDVRRPWTLSMAARYLCFRHNAPQTFVQNPDGPLLDQLLDSRSPNLGVCFVQNDSTTYDSQPILVPDFPATGMPWPVALDRLLEPNGFAMVFRLETDVDGNPYTYLDLFRRQDGSPQSYKDLYLQLSGQSLDPAQTNLSSAQLARDSTAVANSFVVDSRLERFEASFVLAPGFSIALGDGASASSLAAFDRNNPDFAQSDHDQYRLYICDETGEGHWDFSQGKFVETATPLDAVLGKPAANGTPAYVKRRRPPIGRLFTLDANNVPLKASLSISTDYVGNQPGVWDGTGTWQEVLGGFELLSDRLGIWINAANPNSWVIGASNSSNAPYPAGTVRGVEDQANTFAAHFALRLTCVIEGDYGLDALAEQRPSSTSAFTITRRINARDRYFSETIAPNSEFNNASEPIVTRNDAQDALAEAEAYRLAREAGEVAGSAVVPRLTLAYRIGDRIQSIQGRGLSLRTNAGAPSEEGQVFPAVVGLTWGFEHQQHTTLLLSDQRALLGRS